MDATSPVGALISANQLKRRYITALTLIALLTILSQAVVQFFIADQEHDSRVVNIAGRQRMLSQRITKTAFYISAAQTEQDSASYQKELETIVSLWERSHLGLLNGDRELGLPGNNSPEIRALFDTILLHHKAMLDAARHLLLAVRHDQPIGEDLRILRSHEANFLQGMDEIVFLYDQEARQKISIARWLELALMVITLLVLVLEAFFIFAPATRRLQQDMRELLTKEEDMENLFSASPTAMLLADTDSLQIVRANQKAADLIGDAVDKLIGSDLRRYLPVTDSDENQRFIEKITRKENLNDYEIVLLAAKDETRNVLVSVRQIIFAAQMVFILGLTNINEIKKAQRVLEYFATYDDMTGLINRRTGLLMLTHAMARARRDQRDLTVCFADLDGLKETNDRCGHAEGDWLLTSFAQAITPSIREGDIAIRLGGDEFLLVFHDCSVDDTQRLLARIDERLSQSAVRENKPFSVGFSHGCVVYDPVRHASQDQLIAEVDALMYQRKQAKKRANERPGHAVPLVG